ncbi:hypothetical protein [Actinopolymorpha pittospori]|uniref:Uncharacterized protein n=2 Tax=Actinopolymorpha pittospori TaxID=648752 RepID=A0A927R5W0_9ACTN|nr:hypothetical protein [Actinopolymorpha pittospori]MBE1603752.1 hypothetical protein [Actinopolymorpha pittospori]
MAVAAYERSAGTTRTPKQAAAAAVEHARALVAADDVEQACRVAVDAYDAGRAIGSERARQAVRDFRAGLGSVPARFTCELDDRLHNSYLEDA